MEILQKTNRVLQLFSLCLILFLIRVWYLGVVQHDYHVQQSKKPQRRIVIEKAPRATIQDRFGIPLAVNKIQYNASIYYANIRQIPSVIWKKGEDGQRIRVGARKEHIQKLSKLLSFELGLEAEEVEDLIHGKAALMPHTPFVIKEDISEEQYYRLKMLEKDWLGLQAERVSRRHYPQGKVACDILGYLGAMDSNKYLSIIHELNSLEEYLTARERGENPFLPEGFTSPDEAYERWRVLCEKSYTMNDLIGKAGVEGFYEEALRGSVGKQIYEIDRQGRSLQKLPQSQPALSGKKLTLTISAELQAFAEQLLAAMEGKRLTEGKGELNEAWMRGGAVVAMLPKTGELVALASYPRFDPNDFIPTRDPDLKKEKELQVCKWLENESYIGAIWEGRRPIEREYFSFVQGRYIEERLPLTWEVYLRSILRGPLYDALMQIHDLRTALEVQKVGTAHPLLREISLEEDRLLIIDLCHLMAPQELFSEELARVCGPWEIGDHFQDQQIAIQRLAEMKEEMQEIHKNADFKAWRNADFKNYLKLRRFEEKKKKSYPKPYPDYLEKCRRQMFKAFWDSHKSIFLYVALTGKIPISLEDHSHLQPYLGLLKKFQSHSTLQQKILALPPSLGVAYLKTLRSFEDLVQPLKGKYSHLRSYKTQQLEKHLAAAFYPLYGYGFSRSQSYRQTSAQGSVFKLITAYQVLLERLRQNKSLDPLTLIDDLKGDKRSNFSKQILGYELSGEPIYRAYKGGWLPRSSHGGMGRIDLIGALEQSSNIYFSILAAENLQDPSTLSQAAHLFNLGEKTGVDLAGEAKGTIANDLNQNLTNLYSFAIGQHTLTVTPLQTAVMVSALANQGRVVKPYVVQKSPEILRTAPLPKEIFQKLTEGMRRAVTGPKGTARPAIMRHFYDHPEILTTYREIHPDILVKTGTAQELYKPSIAKSVPAQMREHVWFAAIAYPEGHLLTHSLPDDPELVVIVYLRFRQSGREGGTIAAQIIKKWRELRDAESRRLSEKALPLKRREASNPAAAGQG